MPYNTHTTNQPMTDLSPQAQAIVDAYESTTDKYDALAAVLRALVNEVVPHEDEAPKAVFGTNTMPISVARLIQETLNIRREQRQQTRSLMLAVIVELEQIS